MNHTSKEARKSVNKRYYLLNKDAQRKRNLSNRARNRSFVISVKKGKPCMDCKKYYPHYVMEFDHVVGEKRNNVAVISSSACSIKTISEEIDKCELVCANCHRERTEFRRLSHSGRAPDS